MFGVISSVLFSEYIDQVLESKGGSVLHKIIENDIDITSEFEKIERLPITHLIFDISTVQDKNLLIKTLSRYRILQERTHIIIITPDSEPGEIFLSALVTMSIYSIIAPKRSCPEELLGFLEEVIDHPYNYKKAVRWLLLDDTQNQGTLKASVSENNLEKPVFGTITISVAGLQHGSGTTYNVLKIAKYIASLSFRVAVIELKPKNSFGLVYLPRRDSYSSYHFRYDNFDIFANDGEISPEELLIAARSGNYNYLILDTGLLFTYDYEKAILDRLDTPIKKFEKGVFYNYFMQAEIKLVTSYANTQYADSLEYYINYLNTWQINDLKTLFSFANKEQLKSFKILKPEIYINPINCEDKITEEQEQFFQTILNKVLPNTEKKKNTNFFKKLKESIKE